MKKWVVNNVNINPRLIMVIFVLAISALYSFLNPFSIVNAFRAPDLSTTRELLEYIIEKEKPGHLRSFTFIQQTVRFDKEGQASDTTLWYEAIRYPKDFRIDFGNPVNGNANVNRNDSIYVFRNKNLVHKGPEIQEFLILEGGLFYYPVQETLNRLKGLGIDPDLFGQDTYKGREVYIIGSKADDHTRPQVWIDAERFYVVRRFSKGKQGELYEVRYDDFRNIEGHWIESWIEFYVGDTLIQTERYTDIRVNPDLSDKVFDPNYFGKYYWFE